MVFTVSVLFFFGVLAIVDGHAEYVTLHWPLFLLEQGVFVLIALARGFRDKLLVCS